MPGTYKYVTLYGKGDPRLQVELRLLSAALRIRRFSWILQAAQHNHEGPKEWKGRRVGIRGMVWDVEGLQLPLLALKMDKEGTYQGMQVAFRSWKKQGKGTDSP